MTRVVRSGPLTPAQQNLWTIQYWRSHGRVVHPQLRVWDLPPGIGRTEAVAAIEAMMRGHEVLRTVFVLGADLRPCQIVLDHDRDIVPVSVVSADDFDDLFEFDQAPIACPDGMALPWELILYELEGSIVAIALRFEHVVTDGAGLASFFSQFVELCTGDGEQPAVTQPLDRRPGRVRAPGTRDGARSSSPVRHAPMLPVATLHHPPALRYVVYSAEYDTLLPGVDDVCQRYGVSRANVVMLLIGLMVSSHSGSRAVHFSNVVGHRRANDSGLDCQMRPVDVVLLLDDGVPLGDALRRVQAENLRAYSDDYRFGPYEHEDRILDAYARGLPVLRPVLFNFQGQSAGGPVDPSRGFVRETPDPTTSESAVGTPFVSSVNVYVKDSGEVVVDLDVDLALFPAHVLRELLSAVSPLVDGLRTASPGATLGDLRDLSRSLVGPAPGADGDTSRATIDEMEKLLRQCGAAEVSVARVDERWVATVVDASIRSVLDLHELHERYCWTLSQWPSAVIPDDYVVGDMPPPACRWSRADAAPVVRPDNAAEKDLWAAFSRAHGFEPPSMAETYARAGGRLSLAPGVAEVLRRRGWCGLKPTFFSRPVSLRQISGQMRRVSAEGAR